MNRLICIAISLILISGCAAGGFEEVNTSRSDNYNRLKGMYRLRDGEILVVSPGKANAARAALGNKDYEKISVDLFNKITGLSESYAGSKNIFIVKSKKDDMKGVYSGLLNQGRLNLIYNHMGECGQLVSDIVIVVMDAELTELSSGCSGAL
ncbi:hypothetical protein JWH11_09330 [Xanthomonas melonis]|uniref:DUF4252 domain-containing protein n=1 Tax=Xanthomonas melonis TaxID=56456 RepID=A0ABS8NU91_9XANT|nr:hypothetical protein [Xanthomonas melonis]MCD0245088.1 hypothetical protein [Xanthomonas melonis]MCD0258410.1 hypothetical protein [Xanthomonas melonis]MCD0266630.1 hypothetical protein [Xanthomonas melonis]MCD0278575.1 hypothetical protein [Xanthomonas melonis]